MSRVKEMVALGKELGLQTLGQAHSHYTRHYDVFFRLDDTLDQQFKAFDDEIIALGWTEDDGKHKVLKDISIDDAIQQLRDRDDHSSSSD